MIFISKEHLDKVIKRKQRTKDNRWCYNEWSNNRVDVDKSKFQNQSLKDFGATGNKGNTKQQELGGD